MFTTAPRTLLAAALGLGALSVASEAQAAAAYVCEIRLAVNEELGSSGSSGQQFEFQLQLTSAPFCGGHAVGLRLHIKSFNSAIYTPRDPLKGIRSNAIVEYEDTALLGAFLQLHSAAALGLAVEVDSPRDSSITLHHHGLTISHDRGPLPPGGSQDSIFRGYVCRSATRAHDTPRSINASGHKLDFTLTANPGCSGGFVHRRILEPQTESNLPQASQSGRVALHSYQQARLQQFNLATVALGHAMMIAQATDMLVQVDESSHNQSLGGVLFRATPTSSCPQPPPPKVPPKVPTTKPTPKSPTLPKIPDPKRPLPLPDNRRGL